MINDAQIRQMMIRAVPNIDPSRLEVCMVNYDVATEYRYRGDGLIFQGRAPAIQRTEIEIATVLAADLSAQLVTWAMDPPTFNNLNGYDPISEKDVLAQNFKMRSHYEGKRGKHPKDCTCSKHLKATNGPQ